MCSSFFFYYKKKRNAMRLFYLAETKRKEKQENDCLNLYFIF
ncbi:hypothetical protein D356_00106 [Enterococcus faecium SD2A-2]|uniref:Uncharacterized protein n=1 Tax=Enterococcus faecium SD2A-2 TaxID=1244154 RepID=A0AB73AD57_ENTFC|nr:hypothetical protein D356_00106 [Enterococcus faecium SD2A-2]KXA11632.1 hypothetical protein HMPREF3199_00431 [Enterococcus faecium]MBK4786496.1 hypothetical protein [Enterococcus faecium]MBK4873828.1 hypothetical protein [Enterococcus faecium]MBL4988241.1 hypothetical protein [Enterococcus lactis]